jgi:Cof subfamily protein (haloacid dehalogenase superfamily)
VIPELFVTDLDGTLLKDDEKISLFDLEALRHINKLGCGIVIATGRPYRLIPDCVKDLSGLDYIISANGAVLYDCLTGLPIAENYLEKDTVLALCEEAAKNSGGVDIYFTDKYICEKRSRELMSRFIHFSDEIMAKGAEIFTTVFSAGSYLFSKTEPIIKTVCIFESPRKCEMVLEKLRRLGHVTAVTLTGYEIEVTSKNATKGNALRFIRELRKIKKEQVMAIGDNENDLSMRDEAGYFIAMGNAGEKIKAAADYISAGVNEDGVARAINTLILKNRL